MKGYSLVGVLVAMLILMTVMVPLFLLQGKMRQKAYQVDTFFWQSMVEEDLRLIKSKVYSSHEKTFHDRGRTLHRKIQKAGPNLLKVTYHCVEPPYSDQHYCVWIYLSTH